MDLKTPVLAESAPIKKSRLSSMHPSLLPYSAPPQRTLFSTGMLLSIPRKKIGALDDVRAATWLDAMKSSSPPPKPFSYDANSKYDSSDGDAAYRAWTVTFFFCTSPVT
ncbi:Trehalose-phosphate phosphatase A [Bienertia sinuspersici]